MTVTRINTDPVPELEMWVQELRAGLVHKRGLVQETYFKDFKDKDKWQQKYKYNYEKIQIQMQIQTKMNLKSGRESWKVVVQAGLTLL